MALCDVVVSFVCLGGLFAAKAPKYRSLGIRKWGKMRITDKTFCKLSLKITLDFSNLPTGAEYHAWVYYVCKNGTKPADVAKTAKGGTKLILTPSTNCSTLGDDSGTVYVNVTKIKGKTVHSKQAVKVTIST